jgi:DNA-binding LacI/PurR family transcriptional regulator
MSAKKLRSQSGGLRSFDIAVITSFETPTQFLGTIMHAVEKITALDKYKNYVFATQVAMFHAGKISEMPGILDESRFNGAIITNTTAEDDKFFMEHEVLYPVVFLGRYLSKYNCVSVDVNMSGKMAADVLLNKCGCINPVVLLPQVLTQATLGRLNGFRAECIEKNIQCNVVNAGGFSEESGYTAVMDYIRGGGKIDGLYSVYETLAIGAYSAIEKNDLKIPDDVAVIETGETAVGRFLNPPISSFSRSEANMDEVAVEMLMDQLLGNNDNIISRILPSITVSRESTNRSGSSHK